MIFTAQAGTLADATLLATMSVRGNTKIVKLSDGAARVSAAANIVDVGCFDRCVTIRASAAATVIEPGSVAALARAELQGALTRLAAAATDDGVSLIVLAWSHDAPLEIYLVRQLDAGADLIDAVTKGAARVVVPLRGLAALLEEIKGEHVEIMGTNPIRLRATDNARKFTLLCQCHWNFNESS